MLPDELPTDLDNAISRALAAYCRGVDRRDWDLVRAAFHTDAVDDHGVFVGSVDQMIEWMQDRHHGIASSMHVLGQSYRRQISPERVVAETYCVAYQTHRGADSSSDTTQVQVRCRYLDEFTAREGHWRIVRRTVVFDSLQQEVGLAVPARSEGARDTSDPSYLLLDIGTVER
jgi:hypothetical protein